MPLHQTSPNFVRFQNLDSAIIAKSFIYYQTLNECFAILLADAVLHK